MYEYRAQVLRVIDGDSVRLDIDLGFSIRQKTNVRLNGIDAPEIFGVKKARRGAGIAAKEYLESLIRGSEVTIKTFKDRGDKYGRLLADIFVDGQHVSVNDLMVSQGHAKVYRGGKR